MDVSSEPKRTAFFENRRLSCITCVWHGRHAWHELDRCHVWHACSIYQWLPYPWWCMTHSGCKPPHKQQGIANRAHEGIRSHSVPLTLRLSDKAKLGPTYSKNTERNPAPVEVGSLSHYFQGFIHPKWLFEISSINSKDEHFFVGYHHCSKLNSASHYCHGKKLFPYSEVFWPR